MLILSQHHSVRQRDGKKRTSATKAKNFLFGHFLTMGGGVPCANLSGIRVFQNYLNFSAETEAEERLKYSRVLLPNQ